MATKLASIIDSSDIMSLPDGSVISMDSPKFSDWLENNNSFRFDYGLGGKNGFTARKEKSGYWYAYRTIQNKIHKRYIGNSSKVTLPKLSEVAESIITQKQNIPTQQPNQQVPKQSLTTQLPNQITETTQVIFSQIEQMSATIASQAKAIETMQRALTALVERMERLETPKTPQSLPTEVEVIDGYTIQLGKRVNELEALARDLKEENEQLKAEVEQKRADLIEAYSGNAEAYERANKLANELETAQQRIAQLEEAQTLQQVKAQTEKQLTPEVNTKTLDDFLAGLKLGKQSPDYKAAKRWVSRFVEFVELVTITTGTR